MLLSSRFNLRLLTMHTVGHRRVRMFAVTRRHDVHADVSVNTCVSLKPCMVKHCGSDEAIHLQTSGFAAYMLLQASKLLQGIARACGVSFEPYCGGWWAVCMLHSCCAVHSPCQHLQAIIACRHAGSTRSSVQRQPCLHPHRSMPSSTNYLLSSKTCLAAAAPCAGAAPAAAQPASECHPWPCCCC